MSSKSNQKRQKKKKNYFLTGCCGCWQMSVHVHKPITVKVDNGTIVKEKAEEKESVLFPFSRVCLFFSKKKGCPSFKNVLKKMY